MTNQTNQLADAFAAVLRTWLTADEITAIDAANRAEDPARNICHSHDYCDANMAMWEAFEDVVGREPVDGEPDDTLWVDAWNVAQERGFAAQTLAPPTTAPLTFDEVEAAGLDGTLRHI